MLAWKSYWDVRGKAFRSEHLEIEYFLGNLHVFVILRLQLRRIQRKVEPHPGRTLYSRRTQRPYSSRKILNWDIITALYNPINTL